MKMLRLKLLALIMLSLISVSLAGCATKPTVITQCTWVKPIYPSKDDVLTKGTKVQIVVHNESWESNKD